MSKSLKDSEEVMNSTARISAREHNPGKLAEMVIFLRSKNTRPSNNRRPSNNSRPSNNKRTS